MSNIVTGELRVKWEAIMLNQIDRHRLIDPNVDPKKIVELTIRQAREQQEQKLSRILELEELEDLGEDNEIQLLVLRSIIDVVLPELEVILKRRY